MTIYCPECGKPVVEGHKFCWECGASLEGVAEEVAAARVAAGSASSADVFQQVDDLMEHPRNEGADSLKTFAEEEAESKAATYLGDADQGSPDANAAGEEPMDASRPLAVASSSGDSGSAGSSAAGSNGRKAPAPAPNNTKAMVGMVLGIFGVVMCWIPLVDLVGTGLGIAAIILGYMALKECPSGAPNHGVAVAALVCGIVATGIGALGLVCTGCLFAAATGGGDLYTYYNGYPSGGLSHISWLLR